MPFFAIAFLLGDLTLQFFSELPSKLFLFTFAFGTLLCFSFLRYHWRYAFLLIVYLFGFTWTYWQANSILFCRLAKNIEGQSLIIKGIVASIPQIDKIQTRFLFKSEQIYYLKKMTAYHALVALSWRHPTLAIKVGDRFQLMVRLQRIHSSQNPGSIDFEALAFQKGLGAKGYVLPSMHNQFLQHDKYVFLIDQMRENLYDKLFKLIPNTATAPWLMALILGERAGIAQSQWEVLRRTGTNHLMAIAGLHIGFLVLLVHLLISVVWQLKPQLALYFPRQAVAAGSAFIMAIIYSTLAGFSIPTQRACIMLAVFVVTSLSRYKVNPWQSWSLALFLILIIQPLNILNIGFWLSFLTIAIIIYCMRGRLSPQGWWWKWGRVQITIALGLLPLSIYFFQTYSFISFFANIIAIPWLTFLILPFCFVSVISLFFSSTVASWCLIIADKNLAGLWHILTWLAHFNLSALHLSFPHINMLIASMIGILFLLLPRGFPGKGLCFFWLLPIYFYQPLMPRSGEIRLTLLDVGQGLAVVIKTHSHILVYDAGPKLNENFDMGEQVVLPYLHFIQANKIDMLVISHGDNDHIGGANALIHALPIHEIKTSVPKKILFFPISYCLAKEQWTWDEVNFKFIYPEARALNLGNNSSCVLQIDNGTHSILLTGDIEKFSERQLAKTAELLHSDILIAPHHGSKTSAVKDFIETVKPTWVLFAIGYRNRYHFPHPEVVKAYEKIHARQLNSAQDGAIEFKIGKAKVIEAPYRYRIMHQQYWHDK